MEGLAVVFYLQARVAAQYYHSPGGIFRAGVKAVGRPEWVPRVGTADVAVKFHPRKHVALEADKAQVSPCLHLKCWDFLVVQSPSPLVGQV